MFSRILRFSAALFSHYNAPVDSKFSFQVDQQLQTELVQAAERGMVSTRSQENTPAGGFPQASRLLHSQDSLREKKRNIGHVEEQIPVQSVTKRRRTTARSNGDAAPSSSTSKPGTPPRNGYAKISNGDNKSDQDTLLQGSPPTSPQTPGISTNRTVGDNEKDSAIEVTTNKHSQVKGSGDQMLEAHDKVELGAGGVLRSRKSRTREKPTTDSPSIAQVNKDGANTGGIENESEGLPAKAAKATHKRFVDEAMEATGTASSAGTEQRKESQESVSEDESESGSEAPETVTVSAGFDKVRASALEVAKVAARQNADRKIKRKEHDQLLKLQAKSAKDSRHKDERLTKSRRTKRSSAQVTEANGHRSVKGSESAGETSNTVNEEVRKSKASRKASLPLRLPAEILAAQPVVHTPRPSFPTNKVVNSQKRQFLDLGSKPPKDIKRGNRTICVLQDNRSILPPKSSHNSKALREYWLTGQRGYKGAVLVPRRKPNSGFVRSNV